MRTPLFPKFKVSVFVLVAFLISAFAGQTFAQGMGGQTKTSGGTQTGSMGNQPPNGGPQTPNAPTGQTPSEEGAASKVKDAKDGNAAVNAALEYSKSYPNGKGRLFVMDTVAEKIGAVAEPSQRATLCEKVLPAFQNVNEADGIFVMLVEKKQYDDAFRLGSARIQKIPGEVVIMTQLAVAGREEIKTKNPKHQDLTFEYSQKAEAFIEAGTKPVLMADDDWTAYKTKWLNALYQTSGLIDYMKKDVPQAQKAFQKAMQIDSNDAFTYLMLGAISDDQYQDVAEKFHAAKTDDEKQDLGRRGRALLSQTADLYTHAAGLAESSPDLKPIFEQAKKSLEPYYKALHGSTDSMQADIDKYKKS